MPSNRVHYKHLHYQLLDLNADLHVVRKCVQAPADSLIKLLRILAFERKPSAEHGIKQNAACPDIGRWSAVVSPLNNLWTHIAGGSTEHPEIGFAIGLTCEPEVDEFDLVVGVDDYVFKLDVSVRYFVLMKILDCLQQLLHNYLCFLL